MTDTTRYEFVRFPRGERRVTGVIYRTSADQAVAAATAHATVCDEYTDVVRNGVTIATVGAEGPV